MTTMFRRQSAILDPSKIDSHVTVLGLGTVGSNAAIQLVKLGVTRFTLCDYDTVELHNVPSQYFTQEDVGLSKGEVVRREILRINPEAKVTLRDGKLSGGEDFCEGIVVLAVDKISLREKLFHNSIKFRAPGLMIDVRMHANVMYMWAIDPYNYDDCEKYESTLHDASQSMPTQCGGRTFAPVGAVSGAMIAQTVTKYLKREAYSYYMMFDMDMMTLVRTEA